MEKTKLAVPKVSLYNPVELKKVLDLGLEEILKSQLKYDIDYWYSNTIIICSIICSLLGALAWWYPKPWPESYWHIVSIIVIYIIVDGYLTYIMWFRHKGFAVAIKKPKAIFYSAMIPYTPYFKLTMCKNQKEHNIEIEVNKVFDSDGKLLLPLYQGYVEKLLNFE
ncbi:hypothetical protein EDI_091030 [Entamoeba dispar SAW760]|uniref:Signal peptidase complex subunit 2 n=1 Tax=Entamoeba dispar (strain ATCC PRA-260 / SAW760) TaxID=370354 RepID=B0EDK3_ENTDS|nr:uncharacterized protein EDI_091030 [Entamoeba dispar SAW760]EDR27401.1 hypothetical protein EDI_091030 [Entamoeba dispar SAW760]|eukprot:EDR27401.1 hypothetical protein EDI_091030 [Entamoeba dispar SAW760]